MNQPSIPTDAEIRLLTEMLANHDSFDDEGDPATNAQNNSMECPAPAVLWALFEPAKSCEAVSGVRPSDTEAAGFRRSLRRAIKPGRRI